VIDAKGPKICNRIGEARFRLRLEALEFSFHLIFSVDEHGF